MMMKLSVLLISYNQEKFIKECVESILSQEVSFGCEIVVADDHSTDATLKIITDLLAQGKFQYKILNEKHNLGMRKNYQRGFAACSGQYIAIMEGDDYWCDPKRLSKHVAFLDDHPECAMSFNRLMMYHEARGTWNTEEWRHSDDFEYITTAMLARRNRIFNLSACIIRDQAFLKIAPELHEMGFADWMLGMALGEIGKLVKFRETMSVYRVHKLGQWSGRTNTENFSALINITIPQYDKFLCYKYHAEFEEHKKDLEEQLELERSLRTRIARMLSIILPEFSKAWIRKIIY